MTVALGEDQRVIGGGVDLDLDEVLDIVKVLAADALDLRHAAEAVVILHALLIVRMHDVVLEVDLAGSLGDAGGALDELHHVGSGLDLGGVGAGLLDALVKRAGLAADGFKRQRGRDLGELVQALGVVHVQARHTGEHCGAVEQHQAVLGLELKLDGGNAGLFQRFLCRHALTLIEGLGLGHADENGDDVSHGGKVAAGAHAALPGHDGMHTLVEQLDKALNDDRTQAGNAAAEGVQTDAHGRADHFLGSRITDAAAVGQNGAILMQIALFDRDLVILVLAKAGVEAVNGGRVIAHPFTLHVVADFGDMCHAVLVDLDLITVAGNVDDVFNGKIHAVENNLVHLLSPFSRFFVGVRGNSRSPCSN